jgi:hypothetical protein
MIQLLLPKVAPKVSESDVSCMLYSDLLEKYYEFSEMLNILTNHVIGLLSLQYRSKLWEFFDGKSSSTTLLVKYICSTEQRQTTRLTSLWSNNKKDHREYDIRSIRSYSAEGGKKNATNTCISQIVDSKKDGKVPTEAPSQRIYDLQHYFLSCYLMLV